MIAENSSLTNLEDFLITLSHLNEYKIATQKTHYLVNIGKDVWPNFAILNVPRDLLLINEKLDSKIIIFKQEVEDLKELKMSGIYPLDIWYSMEKIKLIEHSHKNLKSITDDDELVEWTSIVNDVFYPLEGLSLVHLKKIHNLENIEFLNYFDGVKAIGTALIFYSKSDEVGIYFVAITKECQKQGKGSNMLKEIEGYLFKKGVRKIVLQSTRSGRNLYSNHNFKETKNIHLFIKK